ncbi:MAG: lysophospholipid acyltransferase family protein [Planctomycetota bacterium]|jgi:1-acyl-sn-glycerol-3-phosphate acyltransferase
MPKRKIKRLWFPIARGICNIFCRFFFNLRIYGKENVPNQGAFILVCNHQSLLDPVFAGIPLKQHLHFLARDTLFTNRFFGWLIASVNTIPVKRGQADLSAIKAIIERLKSGDGACLFPEGTRTEDGKIAPFKPGFGLLCRRAEAAIVPVMIDGAFECWPRHKKIFSPGAEITIRYGTAINPEQVRSISDRKLAEDLTSTLRQMQNDYRAALGRQTYEY